jgi:hypothetical protein
MSFQVNDDVFLTGAVSCLRSSIGLSEHAMVTYFAVFCALAICVGGLLVKIYEWRQDVLYGSCISRDRPHQKN